MNPSTELALETVEKRLWGGERGYDGLRRACWEVGVAANNDWRMVGKASVFADNMTAGFMGDTDWVWSITSSNLAGLYPI